MSVKFHNTLNKYFYNYLTKDATVSGNEHLPLRLYLYKNAIDITAEYFNLPNGLEINPNTWNIYRTTNLFIINTQTFDFGLTTTSIHNDTITHILKDSLNNPILSFEVDISVPENARYKIPVNGISIKLISHNTLFSERLYKYIFLGVLDNPGSSWWVQLVYDSNYLPPRIELPKDNFSPIYKNKTGLYCITAVFDNVLIPASDNESVVTRIELWDSQTNGNKLFETDSITAGIVYIDHNKYLEFNNFTIVLPNDELTSTYTASEDFTNVIYLPLTAYLGDVNKQISLIRESVSLVTDLSKDAPCYVVSHLNNNAEIVYTAPNIPEYFTWVFYLKLLVSSENRKFIYLEIPDSLKIEHDTNNFNIYLNNELQLSYQYQIPVNIWYKYVLYRSIDNNLILKFRSKTSSTITASTTLPQNFNLNVPTGNLQINSINYPVLGYASLLALYDNSNTTDTYDIPSPYKVYTWDTLTLVDWLNINYNEWLKV